MRNGRLTIIGSGLALLLQFAASTPAQAQQYVVSEEENDARPTVYTLRNNWSQPPGCEYHNTTMIRDGTTNACGEFPCLDDGEPGDLPPNGMRNGTATAVITGMAAGTYKIEFYFRQSDNRSTSVPWRITTDAASNNSRAANINQRDADTWGFNEGWRVLASSDTNPVAVASRLTFVFGSDTINFSGSISYGGIRATRIVVTPQDAGSTTGLCQGIVTAGYELCAQTATTCSGVYTNGEGCVQYCAAAGMLCSSRYGASAGCVIEPQNPFACTANNGQLSNWCDCRLPVTDAGPPDTRQPDTWQPDTWRPDANRPDTWQPDTRRPDANRPDTWQPDAWAPDHALPDRGDVDDLASATDTRYTDGAHDSAGHGIDAAVDPDAATEVDTTLVVTAGCGCRAARGAAVTSPSVLLSIAVLIWGWRRRDHNSR